jgi:hypothetical protein
LTDSSPDINPIEKLWGLLVKKIEQQRLVFHNRNVDPYNRNKETANLLTEKEAFVNVTADSNRTALSLHCAAKNGDMETAELSIECYICDFLPTSNSYLPNVCGKRNFPRKHFPAYKENVETVELLIDNGTSVRDLRMTGL